MTEWTFAVTFESDTQQPETLRGEVTGSLSAAVRRAVRFANGTPLGLPTFLVVRDDGTVMALGESGSNSRAGRCTLERYVRGPAPVFSILLERFDGVRFAATVAFNRYESPEIYLRCWS